MGPKNLIIVTSDELRGDSTGFGGNPDCKTPNLDAFAQKSVVFDHHFAVHGKCVPSRISIVTGRYSHTDGYRTITQHLPPNHPNLLTTLKAAQYETAVFGINHVWHDPDFWGTNKKSSGCVDYHSYTDDYFRQFTNHSYPVQAPASGGVEPLNLPEGYNYRGRIDAPLTGFSDDARTDQAIHYLRNVRDRSRPFFMQLNISHPHPPYGAEEPYFSMYDRKRIRSWPHALPKGAPLPLQVMRAVRTTLEDNDAVFREIQATYYASITKVDHLIGKLFAAVEAEGLFDDTVILFAADHGDFAGQYGLVEKWDTAMNDCILHVPCVLFAPGLPQNKRVDSLTAHTDLAPTLLELLRLKANWNVHGESLLPIIAGEKSKAAVFANGGHEDEMLARVGTAVDGHGTGKQRTYQTDPRTMSRTKMVRSENFKLVVRLTGGNELYDLRRDPYETENLWGREEYQRTVQELLLQLTEWSLRTDTDLPYQSTVGA